MSGNRRNRILNLNASAPLSNQHAPQPSHQQARPLPHPYQRLPAPVNDSVATTVPPRPMVIQYAVPHHPPSHHASPQTSTQYPSQVETPMCAPPPQSPTHTRTNSASDLTMERLSQALVTAITPSLVDHEKSVAAIVKKVEGSIEKFAANVKEARSETDNRLFQLTEAMHKSLQIQSAHIKATNKRTERIEALFMATFDRNDEISLVSRLQNIQYTVGELSERFKDSGAQDFSILPHQAQTADATETRALPTPSESVESPSALVQRIYEDKATFCDISEPHLKRAQSPLRPIYKDVASDAMNLEPDSSAMTSLIHPEYKNMYSLFSTKGFEVIPITVPRRIDLSQKVLAKKGESAALTRVKKRKAPTAEQMEPPLKRARQKALDGEVEREMRVKRERLSLGLPSVSISGNANARGKGKVKEREKGREDDKGYKLPSIKTNALSTQEGKKLRPRAPPSGVKWPEKNASGDKKFDQQFIECEK
ncbi:hypothetical protein C0993_001934 [Termitomyces sp. T159_Od127]|nr:hypothetical protein C0993_001934 [Termitomyces sp. T159_Od127]